MVVCPLNHQTKLLHFGLEEKKQKEYLLEQVPCRGQEKNYDLR